MAQRIEGQDFASAAMMRLVAMGLARQGISIPVPTSPTAHVSLADKRAVLGAVLACHGPLAILSIADAACAMAPEPVVQALTNARDIPDLMERWHRLERFSHGRHRVEIEQLSPQRFRLTHRARDHGPPPSMAESLLVLGLLTILTEMTGSTDVTMKTDAGAVWRNEGKWHDAGTSQGVGSVVLTAASASRTVEVRGNNPETDLVSRLRGRLVADPVRRWTVASLAAEAGAAPRTLQRRLTEGSASFSRLVTDARIEVAATHLCKSNGPALAEIAFIAGFADQAHFARTFSRTVGTTPSSYRADFGQ
ncbi:helix-turn-helix transcriptional regulator [Roseovarius mucosus]|uniref:helix-turn-helix transcriptional regulator n=1 Tax=Roseovarius mucosus TaxID=215743 RepID=UPI0035D03EA3|tara:strand:+ start:958 stop:1878 length:921 start_codon:yes stop_codon:yes gene_type:complete